MVKCYSHSRISTFEQCPHKFKLRYIDKIPESKQTIESCLGKAVHEALEWLYTEVKASKLPTLDGIIQIYAQKWQDNYSPGLIIVKKDLTVKDYFNKGVEFIINYFTTHHPFKDNTLELEKRIFISLDDNQEFSIIGFIDRLVYNLEEKRYEIHDYKTANSLPRKEKVDADRQLALYALAIKELFGHDKEVLLVWHYLAHNTKITSTRTNEQLQKLKQDTLNLIKEIEATTYFPHNKGILCDWCGYKGICTAWTGQNRDFRQKISGI